MRVVIQRVSAASVAIDGKVEGAIGLGFVVLIGFEPTDDAEDESWLIKKLLNLRIFGDATGKMNLSLEEVNGEILLISQFTLHASTKKGNRPSFIKAAPPAAAEDLYDQFCDRLRAAIGAKLKTGRFGADMKVSLTNDGPVTIIIDSKQKE